MEFKEAKEKYIHAWGVLGTNWGINKAMAQIHALLLISPEPLCTDTIMEELNISRGNANMNLRSLMDWGIITKVFKSGERKEFFTSEKDVWELSRQVMKERRKRELEPAIKVLKEVSVLQLDGTEECKEFKRMTTELADFAAKADTILLGAMKAEQSWLFKTVRWFNK
jgi:DNA-binding transcriptional regulator GbsR (MarR family)